MIIFIICSTDLTHFIESMKNSPLTLLEHVLMKEFVNIEHFNNRKFIKKY